jgi:hypothetical protein
VIDLAPAVGSLAGVALIAVLALRELRWPGALGRLGGWTIGALLLVVAAAATLRIVDLVSRGL